jgi:hypothetical protein
MGLVAKGPNPVNRPVGRGRHQKPASPGNIQPGDMPQPINRRGIPEKPLHPDNPEADEIRVQPRTGQQADDAIEAMKKQG